VKTKVSLTINAKRYDIDVEDEFAQFLTSMMKEDFHFEGNNDLKVLLQAYVRRCFTSYEQDKQIEALINRLQEL